MSYTFGSATTDEFIAEEFRALDLNDKRLNQRGKKILGTLQDRLSSCIRRLFIDKKEARQAYDFF